MQIGWKNKMKTIHLTIDEEMALKGCMGAVLREVERNGPGDIRVYVSSGSARFFQNILKRLEEK